MDTQHSEALLRLLQSIDCKLSRLEDIDRAITSIAEDVTAMRDSIGGELFESPDGTTRISGSLGTITDYLGDVAFELKAGLTGILKDGQYLPSSIEQAADGIGTRLDSLSNDLHSIEDAINSLDR